MFRRHPAAPAPRSRVAGPEQFTVHSARDDERYIVSPVGELDMASAWQLERELRRVEASDAEEIVLDLRGVAFIDSTGMQPVLHASARSEMHSKRLKILRGSDQVQRCFEISGLTSRLPFVDRATLTPRA